MRRGDPPPEFLIDRSLGVALKEAVAGRGFVVHTLRSIYGEERAQRISDSEWIKAAGEAGHLILTKDDAIRHNPLNAQAVRDSKAKIFCLPNAHLGRAGIQERFLTNLNRIIQMGRKPGPYVYAVQLQRLVLMSLRNPGMPSGDG